MTVRFVIAAIITTGCAAQTSAPLQSQTTVQKSARPEPEQPVHYNRAGNEKSWLEPDRSVVTSTSISILDQIAFVGTTAKVDPVSNEMLDAIASTLTGNPGIKVVEVQMHGDQKLADQRATAIVDELVSRGVTRERLRASGIASAETKGPSLLILERESDGVAGCGHSK